MASSPDVTASISVPPLDNTPSQGSFDSAGAGITGGYNGDSLSLQIIIAFLIGLALYNSLELILLILITFQRYHGLYFWSLLIASFGIIPYSLGFLIKFFQLLNPNESVGYIAVVLLTIGWYLMITGQSVVLWSRLHLLTNNQRILRWTLYMIIIDAILLHSITTVLTFGSNANTLSHDTLWHFVRGYAVMEKIQMVGFFLQETILSIIYIRETIKLLKLSQTVIDDTRSFSDGVGPANLKIPSVRKTMYQLLAINFIIISMDITLLGVEFANLYIIETTLKGAVYSIKLKLEFAVLGKLVQLVRDRAQSSSQSGNNQGQSVTTDRRGTTTALTLEKSCSAGTNRANGATNGAANGSIVNRDFGSSSQNFPAFVDPDLVSSDPTCADVTATTGDDGWETRASERRRTRVYRGSWIDEEMDKHNID